LTITSRDRAIAVGVTLVDVAVVVGRALAAPHDWLPTTDWALIELRVRDVGSSFPLLGAPSAARFHHPGPLLYLLLAPVYRLAGASPWALALSTAVVNAAAVAGTAWTAWRRGRLPLVVLTLAVLVWLLGSLPAAFTRDPWNPWMAVIPFFWFVLLVWSVVDDDLVALLLAAFVGSVVLQAHIGYLFLVGVAFGVMAVTVARGAWRRRTRDPDGWATHRRTVLTATLAAGAVLLVVWTPPLVQQLTTTPGNVSLGRQAFADSARRPRLTPAGTLDVLATETGGLAPWLTGDEPVDTIANIVIPGSAPTLIVPLALLAAGLALGWRNRSARRFVGVVAGADLVGALTVARLEADRVFPYVVRFLWALAALTALAALWAACTRVLTHSTGTATGDTRSPAAPATGRSGHSIRGLVVVAVAGAVLLVGLGRFGLRTGSDLPVYQTPGHVEEAACVRDLLPAVRADSAGRSVHLQFEEGDWPIINAAIANELDRTGTTVHVDEALAFFMDRPGRPVAPADVPYVVAVNDDVEQFRSTPGAVEVATCDRLSPGERAELAEARRTGGAGASPFRVLDLALRDLRASVFRLPSGP
jgi:hypothetical protein